MPTYLKTVPAEAQAMIDLIRCVPVESEFQTHVFEATTGFWPLRTAIAWRVTATFLNGRQVEVRHYPTERNTGTVGMWADRTFDALEDVRDDVTENDVTELVREVAALPPLTKRERLLLLLDNSLSEYAIDDRDAIADEIIAILGGS